MRVIVLGLMAVLAMAAAANASVNLVQNGDFEASTGTPAVPTNWSTFIDGESFGDGTAAATWLTKTGGVTGKAGQLSVKNGKSITVVAYQKIAVTPGQQYQLSGSWKANQDCTGWGGVFFFDDDGRDPMMQISLRQGNPTYNGFVPAATSAGDVNGVFPAPGTDISSAGGKIVAQANPHTAVGQFTGYDTFANYNPSHVINPPYYDIPVGSTTKTAGASYMYVGFFAMNNPSGKLENWFFDDVSVVATPEPATLSLLALGAIAMLRRRR